MIARSPGRTLVGLVDGRPVGGRDGDSDGEVVGPRVGTSVGGSVGTRVLKIGISATTHLSVRIQAQASGLRHVGQTQEKSAHPHSFPVRVQAPDEVGLIPVDQTLAARFGSGTYG
jgi:hypothetical protein